MFKALILAAGVAGAFILVSLIGFFLFGTFSIAVVMGQEFLPNRIGVASGVTLGAAIGFGRQIESGIAQPSEHGASAIQHHRETAIAEKPSTSGRRGMVCRLQGRFVSRWAGRKRGS